MMGNAVTPERPAVGVLAVVLAACSSAPAPGPGPAPAQAPAHTVIATPQQAADDLEVARVNGRAVWASCVSAQTAKVPADATDRRRAALDQCIAFELLAQAAEARGLARAPEVAEATRSAAVNRLVETEFEDRYRTVADLQPAIDLAVSHNAWRMHIVQLRGSTFARFVVPKDAPPALEAEAHALAEKLATELAGETGLFPAHLAAAARRIAAGSKIELVVSDVQPMHQDDLVAPYARALYGIFEVGRTSPAFRTQWGWDVTMWTGGVEPRERTREELGAEAFPDIRRHQFQLWVTQLGKRLGLHIEVDQATVARLDTGDAP